MKNEILRLKNTIAVKNAENVRKLANVSEEEIWLADFDSARSRETYQKAVQQFMVFLGAEKPEELRSVTSTHVIAFKRSLSERGMKPRTINNRMSAISSLFSHLTDKQIVKHNPAKGLRRLKVNQQRVESKVMSPDQMRALLDAPLIYNDKRKKGQHPLSDLQALRDRAVLHVFAYTGCRISELCTLKVEEYFSEANFKVMDFTLKGGKRHRVAVSHLLQGPLDEYIQLSGHRDKSESPLFLPIRKDENREENKPLTKQAIDRIWDKYTRHVGIEGTSPHSARTTFVTVGLEHGAKIEEMQRTVGHSQIKTTQMYDRRSFKYEESASFKVWY